MFPGSYSISEQTSYYKNPTTKNGFKKKKISVKHVVREMYGQGNVRSGKCLVGKCPFGELSVGEVSVEKVSVGELSSGKCQLGNCPVGKLSAYPSGRMLLKTKKIYIVRINEECRTFRIKNWSKSWRKIEPKAFWLNLLFLKENWTLDCLLCYFEIFLKIVIS